MMMMMMMMMMMICANVQKMGPNAPRNAETHDFFPLSEASLGCPVAASALRFCSALAEQSHGENEQSQFDMEMAMKNALKKTSPEIRQHALVGTPTTACWQISGQKPKRLHGQKKHPSSHKKAVMRMEIKIKDMAGCNQCRKMPQKPATTNARICWT